jgi:hypothetical protein
LFEQIDRLTDAYPAVVLIVEGDPVQIAEASWKGALARVLGGASRRSRLRLAGGEIDDANLYLGRRLRRNPRRDRQDRVTGNVRRALRSRSPGAPGEHPPTRRSTPVDHQNWRLAVAA